MSLLAAYRGSEGIGFASLQSKQLQPFSSGHFPVQSAKSCCFSPDGRYFGYICNEGVAVIQTETRQLINLIPVKAVQAFTFSPKGNFVSTFERMDSNPIPNLITWDINTKETVLEFSHKNPDTWKVQWTDDEAYCVRLVTNELQVYKPGDWKKPVGKLSLEGMAEFSISPGKNPCVAVFVPERKGAPAIVRLYGLLSFNYPLSNKSFYKADSISFMWNPLGTNVLAMTHTDTDTDRQSYYGETNLYYLSAVGNYDCKVALDAEGPVHCICWSPLSTEFSVVYGNMPAKAAIFDSRANKIFDFRPGPINYVRYSPQGRLILLAGFGNLAGHVEIWDRKNLQRIAQFKEETAVYCEFLPDSGQILTATLSPRLRVDNRFRIRSYSGEIIWQQDFKELFQVIQPQVDLKQFPDENQLILKAVAEATPTAAANDGAQEAPKAYVPPHLRRKVNSQPPAKQQQQQQKQQPPQQPAKPELNGLAGEIVMMEKKILGIKRKLRQLEQLKERQAAGETLEKNQIEKIANEPEILATLQAAEQELSNMQLKA